MGEIENEHNMSKLLYFKESWRQYRQNTRIIYNILFVRIFKELNPGLFEKNKGPGRPRIYTADIMLPFVQ